MQSWIPGSGSVAISWFGRGRIPAIGEINNSTGSVLPPSIYDWAFVLSNVRMIPMPSLFVNRFTDGAEYF